MSASVLAIVPALNEEATVAAVVHAIRTDLGADVLVVDDGSSDATSAKAIAAGAIVARHPFNLGVGAALRTGFRYAARTATSSPSRSTPTASTTPPRPTPCSSSWGPGRRRRRRLPLRRRRGGVRGRGHAPASACGVLSRIISRRLGTRITDTTSGFRAFGRVAIERFADAYPTAYLSDTVEALLLTEDWGLTVVEVPVAMRERMGGKASNNAVKSIYHLCRLTLVIALHPLRRPLSGGSA